MVDRVQGPAAAPSFASDVVGQAAQADDKSADKKKSKGLAKLAELVQAEKTSYVKWSTGFLQQVRMAVQFAVTQAQAQAEARDPNNKYALWHAAEVTKEQARRMLAATNPPGEIFESAEWHALNEVLKPVSQKGEESGFQRDSGIRGAVKDQVAQGKVSEAVRDADQIATAKRVRAKQDSENVAMGFAQMSLSQMAKALRQKLRKKKKPKVDQVVETGQPAGPDDITRAEVDAFTQAAFETMRALREEIAPRWAPEQQPWLVSSGEREVFDIVLAVVPKELMEQTQAWGKIQDLRAQQQVFTFRAEDKLGEAVRRG